MMVAQPIDRRRFLRGCSTSAMLCAAMSSDGRLEAAQAAADPLAAWADTDDLFTLEVRQAIFRGLQFLTATQAATGSFPDRMGRNVGVVALSGLAMLATGNLPGRGRFGEPLQRCIRYITGASLDSGFIVRRESVSRGEMYGHGFATLFLAEALGITPRDDLGAKVRAAVEIILAAQHSSGGWRYTPQPTEADLSVTICQVMALRAARNAGIYVPAEVITKAIDYIRRSQNPDGGFMYQMQGGESRFPLTAGAIVALQNAGRYEGSEIELAYNFLKRRRIANLSPRQTNYFLYAHYYSVQAYWQKGGDEFRSWYGGLRNVLLNAQADDGGWNDFVGRTYATAMSCLILSAPRSSLPIFQR
ncbi:prenyltransferase/squalene oxidase repeat-containing protein [Roseimaritima ulvae]|uniref:Prenyltransferase and squalene oxidase repeat protein n=1 Tax=Roseimaritima ulvae TaxID=980254 RepID=A0A5B9QZA1_9BACT|nr:prenyltransferase/squalene oxidase repeat-containing protein [Roseimaritima ulvae]QEG43299.1 Prenyltransferase and squalene oxidase repeat protein [Roseimaritima ulvae]